MKDNHVRWKAHVVYEKILDKIDEWEGKMSGNKIKQIMLACDEAGPYAVVWPLYGKQRDYHNLSKATILRISRIVGKLVIDGEFWILPVGAGEIGWFAKRDD